MSGHVALLRGINVGGRNKIPMAQLRGAFESGGFTDVSTYIQSGNVVFDAPDDDPLEPRIEALLRRELNLDLVVVVRSRAQMLEVVGGAPEGFGTRPDTYYSDVLFLKHPLSGPDVMGVVQMREGVDSAWPGDGVVYFQRLGSRRAQSRLSRLTATPEYKSMTIRTWTTTTKLGALLD
jgi:uncharacterized protein (DUF1697 family)